MFTAPAVFAGPLFGLGVQELIIVALIVVIIIMWRSGSRLSKSNTVTPVLDNWKTSVGATIGGIILSALLFGTGSSAGFIEALAITSGSVYLFLVVCFCLFLFQLYYALIIYPSLFSDTPKIKSNTMISFLNGFLGYIIFGCIWNGNLTKRHLGISNRVYAVIAIIALILLGTTGFF